MARPMPSVHAGAASLNAAQAVFAFESPEALLLALATPVAGIEKADRVHRVIQERMDRSFHELPLDNPKKFLSRAIGDLNAALFSAAKNASEPEEVQASIVCLFVAGGTVTYAHIGDARLYLVREGVIRAVTHDHTQAQQMVDQALLKADEARDHPFSRVLLRALGRKPIIDVPLQGPLPVKKGDLYILCSNGLVRNIEEGLIGNTILSGDLDSACNALYQSAEERAAESGDVMAVQAIRFGDASPKKVVAYNPLDNIHKSLLSREGNVDRTEWTGRAVWVRAVLGLIMLIYFLFFAVARPDLGKWFRSDDQAGPPAPAASPAAMTGAHGETP